jgi:hypothetical protein
LPAYIGCGMNTFINGMHRRTKTRAPRREAADRRDRAAKGPRRTAIVANLDAFNDLSERIAENTTLVISTGSDLFKFLKGMTPDGEAK